jgi:exosome complex RNA-binding protein Csl4
MCGKKPDNIIIKPKGISLKCPFCNYNEKDKINNTLPDQQLKIFKK